MMEIWIHFTNDLEFELAEEAIKVDKVSKEYGGLFVYKYRKGFPVKEFQEEWGGRSPLIVYCDESLVEIIQTDPTGDDPDRNEYLIPYEHFDKCSWTWLEN